MGPKSQQDALYLRFFTKKLLLSCAFLSKKRTFSKEHSLLTPIFGQKNVNFFKNTVLSCQFFQNFHEKPPAAIPIFGKKNINSVKALLYFWPKSQQDALFSDFSSKNNCFHAHILSKKRLFSQKHNALISIFCHKTYILSKTLC